MPLKKDAVSEILPFASEGLEAAGDLLSLEEYKNHPLRKRGHIPGIALRELQNREARQATHMAAGLAQFIANRYAPGVRDDADLDKIEEGLIQAIDALVKDKIPPAPKAVSKYDICEFYYFRHPTLKKGFQAAQGGVINSVDTLYPEAWEYLRSTEGQSLCTTEANWQAMTRATWGTGGAWNGIGGAPYYVLDTTAKTLRLPDLRGMYIEAAGFDGLAVGGVHGDAIRNISGSFYPGNHKPNTSGVFSEVYMGEEERGGNWQGRRIDFSAARVVPTAAKNQPRAWGALACVYLGASS